MTRHCVLCQQDKPHQLVREVNADRGALVWICLPCWKRHKCVASDCGMPVFFLLRERLTRLGPYETHTERLAGRRVYNQA